jgi:formylglycine-generating enzyme required for sulfatase activity
VGIRKPNDLGLFDMHGTVWTWCQETFAAYSTIKDGETIEDKEDIYSINDQNNRVFRGGSFGYQASLVRSACRGSNGPAYRFNYLGIRPARTYR